MRRPRKPRSSFADHCFFGVLAGFIATVMICFALVELGII